MSQSKYKPLGDRVIIEPTEAEQTTKSGILIPDSAQEKPQSANNSHWYRSYHRRRKNNSDERKRR